MGSKKVKPNYKKKERLKRQKSKTNRKSSNRESVIIVSGTKPVKLYFPANHPHVILKIIGENYVSRGLTTDKQSGHHSLKEIVETTGKKAYLKQGFTIDNIKRYSKWNYGYKLDLKSEQLAEQGLEEYVDQQKNSKKKEL